MTVTGPGGNKCVNKIIQMYIGNKSIDMYISYISRKYTYILSEPYKNGDTISTELDRNTHTNTRTLTHTATQSHTNRTHTHTHTHTHTYIYI